MDRFAIGWALRLSWLVFLRFQSWVLTAIFVAVVAALPVVAMPGVLRAKLGDLTSREVENSPADYLQLETLLAVASRWLQIRDILRRRGGVRLFELALVGLLG